LVALIVAKLPGHPGLGHPETILAALAHGRFTSKYGLIKEDARHSSFVPGGDMAPRTWRDNIEVMLQLPIKSAADSEVPLARRTRFVSVF